MNDQKIIFYQHPQPRGREGNPQPPKADRPKSLGKRSFFNNRGNFGGAKIGAAGIGIGKIANGGGAQPRAGGAGRTHGGGAGGRQPRAGAAGRPQPSVGGGRKQHCV